MARAYSADMRQRVIGRVQRGASRREAAEPYEVSPSAAVIWVKCFRAVAPNLAVGARRRWKSTWTLYR
jgi:transposase